MHDHGLSLPARGRGVPHGVPGLARRQPPRRAARAAGSAGRSRSSATTLEQLRAWNRTLADARYAAIAWPEEWGGRGAGVMEQVVYAEEMHRAHAPGTLNPLGLSNIAPAIIEHGTDEQKRDAPPPHAPRRRHLVPGLLRAERRLRPRVAAHVGGARRRLLDRERAEDVEHARPHRELVRAARAHRPDVPEAQGHHVPARRHDAARRRGAAARDDHRREGVQRDLLHRRARPGRLHARPGERGLAGRDDDARVRAGHGRQAAHSARAPRSRRLIDEAQTHAARRRPHGVRRPGAPPEARRASTSTASCSSSSPTARSRPSCTAARWAPKAASPSCCGARPSSTSPSSRPTCSGPTRSSGPWARDRVYSRALTIAGGTTQVNKNILAQRILGLPRN